MVTSIPNGVATLITQNVQYALPAGQCYVLSSAALDYSQDGSAWSTLTGATTGVVTGAPFIRCPGSNATVTAKKDVQMGGSGSTVIADTVQVNKGLFGNGTIAAPSIAFSSEPGLGFYRNATSDIILAFSGAGLLRFRGPGNQLVLDVSGQLAWGSSGVSGPDTLVNRVGIGQVGVGQSTANLSVINGTIHTNTTSASTIADTTETDLWTFNLPANTLNANGRGVRIKAWGTTAANTNSKTFRLRFGNTALIGSSSSVASAVWVLESVIIRTGAATQVANAEFRTGAGLAFSNTSPTETLSGAITIRATGQNGVATAGDITFLGAIVETIR